MEVDTYLMLDGAVSNTVLSVVKHVIWANWRMTIVRRKA